MKLIVRMFAALLALALVAGCTMVDPNFTPTARQQIAPEAAHWQTWVLASSDELRPAPPPDAAATAAELAQLKEMIASRDADAEAAITYWDAGAPSYRWIEIALNKYSSGPPNPRVSRGLALLNVALYDAIIATWDAKYAYNRPRPHGVTAQIAMPNSPSYPSAHAAAAGAAATVLSYLFPDEADSFAAMAEETAQSRVAAGVSYPSDVEAGLALGRAVGAKVVETGMADGSDAQWSGDAPSGPGVFVHENPVTPLAGTWRTWVLSSGDQLRPPPPPAYDSDETQAELAEIKSITRTFPIASKAMGWHTFDAAYPYWYRFASQRLFEQHRDVDAPHVALIYATLAIANHDAIIACFDAKYAYWRIRPVQLDPEVVVLFPTPPHPSYPAGHACASNSLATILAAFFPADAEMILGAAREAGESRIWAGIHYRSDIEAGLILGEEAAKTVLARVREMAPGEE